MTVCTCLAAPQVLIPTKAPAMSSLNERPAAGPNQIGAPGSAKVMFSGESGAPAQCGILEDAATSREPTYGLCRHAIDVIFNDLDGARFA